MPYNENIPLSTDKLSSSQVDINNNFQAINTLAAKDHGTFVFPNLGMHKTVTFPIAAAPAKPAAGFIQMFGAIDTAGKPQIWVNTPTSTFQLTGFTRGGQGTPGWTYLPSGILMKWGQSTTNATTTFPVGGGAPVFKNVYNAQVTVLTTSPSRYFISIVPGSLTTTRFLAQTENASGLPSAQDFYYFVIGN